MATSSHIVFNGCFQDWIAQQHKDLDELLQAIDTANSDPEHLRRLVQKSVQHFEDYTAARTKLSRLDAPSFFCPVWITPFENSFLWLGGCRPSLCIRLLYSTSGSSLLNQLSGFLNGNGTRCNLADISASQQASIDALHSRVVSEDDRLSSKMASLQEDTADEPLAMIAKKLGTVGEYSQNVNEAIDSHSQALAGVLQEADELRLHTLKELLEILTPLQAADFLVTSNKLHLSMLEWGKKRDEHLGDM